ncbi:30S ribosomal protein S27ae [Candidatus Woesearchaeota archaeon]|nr:30S ribosomal protein S27ae [Candidatus Woesearchaeota archaeon]
MAQKAQPKSKDKGSAKSKHSNKRYTLYEISGNTANRKNKFCPKCGIGIFMAKHKNRVSCGKCGFTEFTK